MMSILPERVEGPRLVLRRWNHRDVEVLDALVTLNIEHLRPWMPWIADEPLSIDARLRRIGTWSSQWRQGGDVLFGMFLNGEAVGSTGLHRRRGPHGLEIGYWVDRDHLGQGFATEAASLLTSTALAVPDISFVEIRHDKANELSPMVPQRLGYQFIGEAPDRALAPGDSGIECTWRMTSDAFGGYAISNP